MIYRLAKTSPDALILLPRDVLDKLENAGLTETRILLHAAALLSRGAMPEEGLLRALEDSFRQEEVKNALAFWRGVGILDTRGDRDRTPARRKEEVPAEPEETPDKSMPDPDEPPFYSGKDLAEAAEKNGDLKTLVSFVEQRLDKVLNTSEVAKLWSWLDYIKMPCPVLMLIVEDCCVRGHRSLRYFSKAVISFQDQGLTTYEKANEYLRRQTEKEKFVRRIRKLFGMGDRALTKVEDAHLTEWMAWDFSDEMLDLAYEKTVGAASKPSVNYMHKILQNWHEAGAKTPRDVEQLSPKKADKQDQQGDKSYDLDAAFEKAEARQRKGL